MLQIRPNDLVAVEMDETFYLFAILTKQIMFGGHWVFAFHGARKTLPSAEERVVGSGYNAAVDFIVPKREGRLFRVSRGNDFCHLLGPELLQQEPVRGESNYQILRWRAGLRKEADWIRSTRIFAGLNIVFSMCYVAEFFSQSSSPRKYWPDPIRALLMVFLCLVCMWGLGARASKIAQQAAYTKAGVFRDEEKKEANQSSEPTAPSGRGSP